MRNRFRTVTAAITAVAVVASSVVAWTLLGGVDAARAGTLSELEQVGEAGGWRSITALDLDVTTKAQNEVSLAGFDSAGGPAADAVSWFVQLTVTTEDEPAIVSTAQSNTQILAVESNSTSSVSALISLAEAGGEFKLAASAKAVVTAQAFAFLVPLQEDASPPLPAPGGSVAIDPVALVDSEARSGADIEQLRAGSTVSPLGLGEVPSTGVAAVWVQGIAQGEKPSLSVTAAAGRDDQSLFESAAGAAQGLTVVQLDDAGQMTMKVSETTESAFVNIVGWVAAPPPTADRAVIETGLLVADPDPSSAGTKIATVPEGVPEGAKSVFAVQLQAAEPVAAATTGEADGKGVAATSALMAGSASAVIVAEDATDLPGENERATWLGYFAGTETGSGDSPNIEILTPKANGEIDLVEHGGVVTFSGTATSGAGIVAVHLKQQKRFLGAARVKFGAGSTSWEYETTAPSGSHVITAVAIDAAGREADAEVKFTVAQVAAEDVIIANNVVQLGAEDLDAPVDVTADSVTFSHAIDLRVDDILSLPITESTPDGLLRRVTAVQQVGDKHVVNTKSAAINEMVLNAHILLEDDAIDTATQPEDMRVPQQTLRVGEDDVGGGSGASAGGATGSVRSASASAPVQSVAQQRLAEAESIKRTQLINQNETVVSAKSSVGTGKNSSAEVRYASGLPGETPLLDMTLAQSLEILEDEEEEEDTSKDKKPRGSSNDVKGTTNVKGSLSGQFEVTFITRNYLYFELKIDYADQWSPLALPTIKIFETTIRQIEEREAKVEATANGSLKIGASRAAEKSFRPADDGTAALKAQLDEIEKNSKSDDLSFRLGAVGPIPLGASGIFLWLSFYINLDLSAEFTLSGKVSVTEKSSSMRAMGVRFEDGELKPVDDFSSIREPRLTMSASVEANVAVSPGLEFEVRANEMLGVFIGLIYEISLTGVQDTEVKDKFVLDWSLDQKLEAVVGARLQILSVELFEHSLTFVIFDKQIAKGKLEFDAGGNLTTNWSEDIESEASDKEGAQPLVLLVDVSGSMAGERIEQAKPTLEKLIREQPAGAEVGIWTYPDEGNCSPGGYKVPLGAHKGTGNLLGAIRDLETGGNTPTGEAIDSLVMQLLLDGYSRASILLVTDGESNCSVPPCEVAEGLVNTGFDLSIPSIAFNMQGQELEELECLARVTDSQVFEAETEEEINQILDEITQASIEAKIVMPKALVAGEPQRIEVELSNPTAVEVTQVEMLLTSDGAADVVIAPGNVVKVGNIPQNGVVTRAFDIEAGIEAEKVPLTLSVWGENLREAVMVEHTFDVLATAEAETITSSEAPLAADPEQVGEVLRQPDDSAESSFISVSPGNSTLNASEGACLLSDSGVGLDLGAWDTAVAFECGAGSTRELVNKLSARNGSALGGASHLLVNTGAEDIGLAETVAQCAVEECGEDPVVLENLLRAAQELDVSDDLYRLHDIAQQQNDEAGAPVILVGAQPYLFPEDKGLACSVEYDRHEAKMMNLVVSYLNVSLEASVARAREFGVDAYFVKDLAGALRPARTLCDDNPGADVTETVGGVSLVLTEQGEAALGRALGAWSQERTLEPVTDTASNRPKVQPQVLGTQMRAPISLNADAPRSSFGVDMSLNEVQRWPEQSPILQPGQTVRISGSGYSPGSAVYVTLESERSELIARGSADLNGEIAVVTQVNEVLLNGAARIVVLGQNEKGDGFRGTVDVTIGASTPWWVFTLFGFSGILLIAAVTVTVLALRRSLGKDEN